MKSIKRGIFIIIVFFLLIGTRVYASDLTMDVEMGFDGRCRINGINPVKIELLSEDKDVEGELILKIDGRVYKNTINLPRKAKKLIQFSLPIFNGNTNIEISVTHGKDIILNENIRPKIIKSNSMAIGLLSETPEELYYIKNINPYFLKEQEVEIINLDENMDYSLGELKNINIIILDNFNTEALSEKNQEIFLNWIKEGGLIVVGKKEFAHKNLTGIFSGIEEAQGVGRGAVVGLNNPIKEKDANLIEYTIEKNITPQGLDQLLNKNSLNKKAQEIKKLQFIPDNLLKPTKNKILFLTVLLIVYILLIIGLLFWENRPRGMGFAVVIGVSFIFYILAWTGGLGESKIVSSEVAIHNENTTSFNLINIYPYKEENMIVNLSSTYFAKELTNSNYILDMANEEIVYKDINPHYLFTKEINNGEKSKLILELENEILKGELLNPFPHKLYKSFLVIGDTVLYLGDMKSRERINIEYKLDHNLLNLSDYNYVGKISQAAGLDRYERGLLEYYLSQIKEKKINSKLIGFSRNEKIKTINNKEKKIQNHGLNICPVNIKFNGDEILLPPQFIEPVFNINKEISKNIQNEYSLNSGDELLLYYFLPSFIDAHNISLYGKIEGGEMNIEIYNHYKGSWENLNIDMLEGDNLSNYLQNKPLSLKITGEGRLIIPQISVKGKVNLGDEPYE